MRKFMIRCDIEGASGVVSYQQSDPAGSEYAFGQKMFMDDLVALVDSLNSIGAKEIVIYDEHFYGRNIDISVLPSNVRAICGKPPYRPDWPGGLDSSFTGLILLGFHAKEGTEGALLPHTYESDIKDIRLNGLSVGEIGVEAAIAGDVGVPTVLVIADSAGAEEAEELLPGVFTVSVKEALGESGALCYSSQWVRKAIEEKVRELGLAAELPKPFVVPGPVRMEVDLYPGDFLTAMKEQYSAQMNGDTVVLEGKNVTEVWAKYWQMKLVCLERLS